MNDQNEFYNRSSGATGNSNVNDSKESTTVQDGNETLRESSFEMLSQKPLVQDSDKNKDHFDGIENNHQSTGFQVADEDVPLLLIDEGRRILSSQYGAKPAVNQIIDEQGNRYATPVMGRDGFRAGWNETFPLPYLKKHSDSFSLTSVFDDEVKNTDVGGNVHVAELLVGVVANLNEFTDPDNANKNSGISETFFDLTRPRLVAIFDAFDALSVGKKKGVLTYENFRASLKDVGLEIKDKESFLRLAQKVDLDRDQGITFAEFETVVQSLKMAHLFRQPSSSSWENMLRCVNYNSRRAETETVQSASLKSFMYQPRPKWASHRWIEAFLPASFTLKALAIKYRLHPLALEDVINDSMKGRAKLERFDNHIFVVFPILALEYSTGSESSTSVNEIKNSKVIWNPISCVSQEADSIDHKAYGAVDPETPLIRGKHGLYSPKEAQVNSSFDYFDKDLDHLCVPKVRKSNAYIFVSVPDFTTTICAVSDDYKGLFHRVHREINVSYSRLRQQDGLFLLYVLLDCVSDSYMPILAELESVFERLSDQVRAKLWSNFTKDRKEEFFDACKQLDHETANLRRWVLPAQRVVSILISDPIMEKDCKSYLQDVRDHLEQIIDDIASLLQGLHALKEEHNHLLNLKMNRSMHTLTIVTAVALPSQLMSSVYGMNFKEMPFIDSDYGFAIFWAFVILSWFVLYRYFKYSGQL